jgi:hypothetical protein
VGVTRPISILAAVALVSAPACNKDDAPAAATPAASDAKTPDAKTPDAKTPDAKTPDAKSPDAKSPIAAVAGTPPATVVPTMPAIEPLLDLVPASADLFVVSRAPLDFVDGFGGVVLGGKTAWSRLLDALADPASPGADAGMRKVLDEFDMIRTTLTTTGLHLDKGLVVAGDSSGRSKGVLIVAADDVETVPKILATFDPKPEGDPMTCKSIGDFAGWVACATDAQALADYAPGKGGAALASTVGDTLGTSAMASINVAARFPNEGSTMTMGLHTHSGVLQMDVAGPKLAELAELDAPGPASALAVVAPGGSFMWMRLDVEAALAKSKKQVPAMAAGMVRALSGEILVSSVAGVPGFALLFGLVDPTPIAGLIPMAALAKDQVPKSLPDGTKLAMTLEDAADGSGGKVQLLRLALEPTGELAAIREQLGWKSEVLAFVTKQFAAISLGAPTEIVAEVAKASTSGASEALLAALPAGLGADLSAGRASIAVHWELDELHAPGVREQFAALAGKLPAGKVPAEVAVDAAYAAASPLSSISMWASSGASGPVVHMAFRGFGDTSSDEGKAAATARLDVATGKRDAATAYGELVTAYPGSSRITAYRARAGEGGKDAATGVAAVAGALAAIAIQSFSKYTTTVSTKVVPPPGGATGP